MTTLTDTQVITASGGLVELGYSQVTSSVTVGTSVTNVTSTLTVVCDGGPILVEFFAPSARCWVGGDNLTFSLFEDGVQKASPWGESVSSNDLQATPVQLQYRLTPSAGSHTYQVKAIASLSSSQQVRAGSGGTGSTSYAPAFLRVSKIVQATQWPAVTTGTIICTSTTRPASPFEGQTIYETDNDRQLVWNGSAWVAPPVTYRPPACLITRSTDQGISHATDTLMQFTGGATFDTEPAATPMFSSGTNTRITIRTAGIYSVSYVLSWSGTSTSGTRFAGVRLNGSVTNLRSESNAGASGYGISCSGCSLFSLAAGDYLTLNLYQTSGSSLNAYGGMLSAAWVGQT